MSHMNRLCIIPCCIVLMLTAAFVAAPKKDFSENENRYLSSFPEISPETIADGEFSDGISSYIRDHFPFRDAFVGLNTCFERYILGKKESGGVYFAKDGYYIEKYDKPQNTDAIVDGFNRLKSSLPDSQVYMCLVPTAIEAYRDKLPKVIPDPSQLDVIEEYQNKFSGKSIDLRETLLDDSEENYYRLDHHWKTSGAFKAYGVIAPALGFEPLPKEYFDVETVTEDFRGTIFSKIDIPFLSGESIEAYISKKSVNVYYDESTKPEHSLYNPEYLKKKDKYSYFLDNIHSVIKIDSPEAESERSLAIIKDSYANCLVPFLTEHYRRIYVFDTRYYKDSVSSFIRENGIDDVLLLYNMNTIDTDLGVRAVY